MPTRDAGSGRSSRRARSTRRAPEGTRWCRCARSSPRTSNATPSTRTSSIRSVSITSIGRAAPEGPRVSDLLIGDIFRAGARAVPQRVAAAMGERSLTFAEMNAGANTHAHALADLGVACGDRVVLWSNTSIDAVPVFAALAKLGAVFAPANAILGVDEAAEMA